MLCAGPGIYIVVYMGIFLLHRFPVPAQYTLGFVQTFLKDFFCFAFLLVRHAAGAVFGMPESVGVSAVRLILPDVFVLLAADALVVIPDMLMLGVERTAFRTVVALVKLLTYMHGRCIGVRFAAPAAYAVFVFVLAGLGGITSVCRTAGSSCSADAGAVCVAVAGLELTLFSCLHSSEVLGLSHRAFLSGRLLKVTTVIGAGTKDPKLAF